MSDFENLLDELAERTDAVLRLESLGVDGIPEANGRVARLGGGPEFFGCRIEDDDSPGPAQRTIDRDRAREMLESWNSVQFEERDDAGAFAPPEWVREYPSTTYRGSGRYPVPEDWVLGMVEGDGVGWHRYADADPDAMHQHDVDDEIVFDGSDTEAYLVNSWNEHDEVLHTLRIDGDSVFEDIVAENDAGLWQAVAEALARYARDEDYLDVEVASAKPPKPVREQRRKERELERKKEQHRSLDNFS